MQETVYSDALLSTKHETGGIITMLPVTRYSNVLSAPKAIDSLQKMNGAPFAFLVEGEVIDEM